MSMGLEPMWTSLSDMLATRTDDQLLRWKEVAENPRIDNYRSITTLRQLVVDLYNKSIKDIINELSIAVNDEINSRNGDTSMDKKLEARISRLEKLLSHNTKFENYVNFDELDLFFHPDLYQTLGFDRVYNIAKAATEYVTDQQRKVKWGDPAWLEKLKLASALNPRNNPIFDEFCKSMNINFNELDSRTAKLLSSGVRRTLGKYATMCMKANGGKLSVSDRKAYFSKSKQEKLLERRIAKLERRLVNEQYEDDLDEATANYIYNKVKSRLPRKYTSVKLIDGCTDTYTQWTIAIEGADDSYTSYDLTPGKDEDYEPIGGIDVKVSGDDGSEDWGLPSRHFNSADEVVNFILKG